MIRLIESMKGLTVKKYRDIPLRKDFEKILFRYAPTVPHLMVYPEGGVLPVESTSEIIIGI
jgi:hypothetical protein